MAAFWKDETNVTIHRVVLHDSWPQVVQPLADRLCQPRSLPSWVFEGPYPFVSDHAAHLLSELKHAHRDVDETESTLPVHDVFLGRLFKVFDTVMCTITSLRRYTDSNGFDDSGVASACILALVRQIVFTYWPHLSVFESARFVFPRHPTHGSNSLIKFTDNSRSARLLIMLRTSSDSHEKSAESDRASLDHSSPDASDLIPDPPVKKDNAKEEDGATDPESESYSFDVDDDETSSEAASSKLDRWTVDEIALGYRLRRRSPVSELIDVSEGTGCKSSIDLHEDDASQEQVQPTPHTQLDPRLDRQLLQCLSVEDPVYISMLCVGSLDEIWGIMASALYQRWTLGILEPVLGVTFESGFTVAQIVFGWLEDCDVPSDLPKVHIAFGVAGAYDLRNPVASLLFAESLSSLGERMEMMEPSFSTLSENSQLSSTSWRSDLLGKSSAVNERDSHKKVKSWLDESSIYWSPTSMSSESAPRLWTSSRNVSSGPSTTSPVTEVSETTSQSVPSIELPDNRDIATSDQGSVGDGNKQSNRFSASAFAAASNETGKPYSNCIVAWMGFRLVFSYSFPVPKPGELPLPLPSPLQDYNKYTAFHVPTWFNRLDKVLVEDDLGDMLSELEENYEARKVAVQYGRLPPAKELSAAMSTFVRSKLSIILRAAKNARRKKEAARYETISEAESRIDWNNLILECAVGPTVDIKLEQTMRFARNQDVGLSEEDRISMNWVAASAVWLQDCAHFRQNDAQVKVVGSNAPPVALEAAEIEQKNRKAMAITAESQASAMHARMDGFREMSLAKLEPKTGRCDAVVRLSIPRALATQHVGKKFKKADFALLSTSRPSHNEIDTAAPPIIPRPTDAKDFSDLIASSRLQAAIVHPYGSSRSSVESIAVDLSQTQISESEHLLHATPAALSSGSSSTTPMSTPSSSSPPTTTPNASRATIDPTKDDLTLSILNIEYKKLLDTIIVTGVNQGRMYGVSAAKYFEALGIEEFPSFTLIVEGSIGVVTCAYVETPESTMPKVIKLYEKNAISFDISNPLDALNFATFSHFIATAHAEKLRARFEEVKYAFYARCKNKDETLRWNMAHQSGTGGSSHLRVPSLGTK